MTLAAFRSALIAALAIAAAACGALPVAPLARADDERAAADAYDRKDFAACAARLEAIARRAAPPARANALYGAASCYALDGETDEAFDALDGMAAIGIHDV